MTSLPNLDWIDRRRVDTYVNRSSEKEASPPTLLDEHPISACIKGSAASTRWQAISVLRDSFNMSLDYISIMAAVADACRTVYTTGTSLLHACISRLRANRSGHRCHFNMKNETEGVGGVDVRLTFTPYGTPIFETLMEGKELVERWSDGADLKEL